MRNKYFILLLILFSIKVSAVEFTCSNIVLDLNRWNSIYNQFKSNDNNWLKAILDSTAYKLNTDGEAEYEYVIMCTDTLNIERIQLVTLEFVQKYFDIGNATRSDLVQGTSNNSMYFKGKLSHISEIPLLVDKIIYYADIFFTVKFKANRLKITLNVPSVYYYNRGRKFDTKIYALDPFQHYQSYSRDMREADANAFINVNSRILTYSSRYLRFLNENYKTDKMEEEEW